jgi:DNA repair protein RadC
MAMGEKKERIYLVCLDAGYTVINTIGFEAGTVSSTEVSIERMVEAVLRNKAAFAIIAHNHPGNTLRPSTEDIAATSKIKNAFEMIRVDLLDHLILCGNDCFSFAQNKLCDLKY